MKNKHKFNSRWLRFLLAVNEMSYQDLADKSGMSKAWAGMIGLGERNPSHIHELGLEKLFDVPTGFFRQESITLEFTQQKIRIK